MHITYYVASSLDGYIAKQDGDVSWLDELGIALEETGYEDFYSTVDALVMGRNTYDVIHGFGDWPYGDKPTWVCTTKSLNRVEGCNLQHGKTPQAVHKEALEQGVKHLWLVGGGELAAAFLNNKLLTHLSISQMPIILGKGIKLFAETQHPIKLQRISVQATEPGFSQIDFVVEQP